MSKLAEIQKKLKAPKNQKNTFGKYNYRSCEDILEAVKPLLGDATLTISDEIIMIGDRYYVKATASFKSKDETVSVSSYAREAEAKKGMDEAQITGSASSYARKYALNGLFCIDDTKDSDAINKHDEQEQIENRMLRLDRAKKGLIDWLKEERSKRGCSSDTTESAVIRKVFESAPQFKDMKKMEKVDHVGWMKDILLSGDYDLCTGDHVVG